MSITISGLTLYPVKSLAGLPLRQAEITSAGLTFQSIRDRAWAVVKHNGHVLTQRQAPNMALIHPSIENGQLRLSHSRAGDVDLPSIDDLSTPYSAAVWKDSCPARQAPDELSQWLMEALETKEKLALIAIDSSKTRIFKDPSRFAVEANYFSDAAPLLVCNGRSLAALNENLAANGHDTIDMRRFRSNIDVEGLAPFAEHNLDRLKLGGKEIVMVDPCQRCIMTTVNPDLGMFTSNKQPFTSISALNAMPNNPKAPAFGVNARLAEATRHNIQVGDPIEPIWRTH